MNLPNILTVSRAVFALIIAASLLSNSLFGCIAAMALFVFASLTDFYDGYLAKKMGLVSDFGKIMDPIADKVLVLSVLGVLAHLGLVQWWMVIIIAAREIIVTGSRLRSMSCGKILVAEAAGKIKTFCQIIAIIVILLFLIADQSSLFNAWFYRVEREWRSLIHVLMIANVFLTVGSGVLYFKNLYMTKT